MFLRLSNVTLFVKICLFFLIFSTFQFHHSSVINFSIISFSNRYFIILAGTPPTMAYGGTSLFTKAFAPITAPQPTVTPLNIVALHPIHTSCPIVHNLLNFETSNKSFSSNIPYLPLCKNGCVEILS